VNPGFRNELYKTVYRHPDDFWFASAVLKERGMTQTKSDEYRARAVNCEERAMMTTDRVARSQWEELAAQWHYIANQAARLRLAPPEDDIEF
jgi:hypothetical protein